MRSWDLRREMAAAQRQIPLGLRFVFMYFRLKVKYMQAHRQLKRAIRVNKRQRTLQLLEQAEAAAKSKDSRALFGVVRLLCPGGRAQRIRLRGDKGQLLNGEQECRELADYASKLFHAPQVPRMPLLPIPASCCLRRYGSRPFRESRLRRLPLKTLLRFGTGRNMQRSLLLVWHVLHAVISVGTSLNYQPDGRMCSLPGWPNPRNAPATRAT